VEADVQLVGSGEDFPVDRLQFVALLVRAELLELRAAALHGAAVQPGEEACDEVFRLQLQVREGAQY